MDRLQLRISVWLGLLACLMAAAGCTSSIPPFTVDADRARETLVVALDAWKAGQARTLGRRDPPVRFLDDDLATGWRLKSYAFPADNRKTLGPFGSLQVQLELERKPGEVASRTATYQVRLEPRLSVLRAEP